ncbi:hypothetical protein QTG54_000307 [Skeletonema marinoi]|uniref:Uncharacterized protein n=1 Tax=Skeletonema marinoi TaxID=267567 RepID=A0AAD8YLV8_9STRA|nr:hypothetical protein QTG54_000307 [Skeletonema marinoi]
MVGASFVALVSLSAVSISAAAAATADELVAYGMSLVEFDDVRMSESEADFDGSEELWDEALLFEYKLATSYTEDKAITSLGYQPYMICNYAPDKTGIQRAQMGISELNNAERSCGVIRTFNDTIPKVYASNPDAETWMKTNPIHPSMKMVDSTVTTIQARMDGDTNWV